MFLTNTTKLQLSDFEELLHHIVCHLRATLLEIRDQLLHLSDQNLLHLPSQHPSRSIVLFNALQFGVVLQEVLQILHGNVLREICAQSALLFLRLASSAHRIAIDLCVTPSSKHDFVFDHVRRVGHVDARVRVRGTHLRVQTDKSRDESTVHQGGFVLLQPRCHVASHAEIRVLVDGAWNHAAHFFPSQHLREGGGKGGRCLHCWKCLLTDARVFGKTENGSSLGMSDNKYKNSIHGDALLDANNIPVHLAHIVHVVKDERLCYNNRQEIHSSGRIRKR